jgi:PAS domain S-box-containing protein
MPGPIRLLMLEDTSSDAELILRELKRASLDVTTRRVETEDEFRRNLAEWYVDVILADYSLPTFDGGAALQIAREVAPEVPFIFVSGSIGEERAVLALRNGATDYILKDRMSRLGPAVKRALEEKKQFDLRHAAQNALRASAQRFEYATKATSDALWDWDLTTGRVWMSDAMESLTGQRNDQADFHWFLTHTVHPGDAERVESSLRGAIALHQQRWSEEYRLVRADGTDAYVAGRAYVIRNGHGLPVRIVGAVHDISERRRADEELRKSEMRLREAQHLAHVGGWEHDLTTGDVIWSGEVYKILGLDPDLKPSAETYMDLVPPADQDLIRSIAGPQQRTGSPETIRFQHRIGRPDGAERILECRSRIIADDQGVVTSAVGTIQDVTELTVAARTIAELSRRTQLILDCAAEGIVGIRLDSTIGFINPAAMAMLGWTHEELLACTDVHALFHHTRQDGTPYPKAECPITLMLLDGQKRSIKDEVFWRASGEWFAVEYTSAPIVEDGTLLGCVLTFRDVTESQALERQLDLAERIGSLGRVAATIAHEFNNVMMGIQPFAEVILHRTKEQEIVKAAEQIAISLRRGRRVTEEILRFTQPSEPDLHSVDLRSWLHKLEPELQALAGPAVPVVMSLPDIPVFAACDSAQLQQVVTNIFLNARDASSPGREISIALDKVGNGLRITVRDYGPGIPSASIGHIFEPLFTTKRTGTGLGLSVARQIVTRHGGEIEVENAAAGGAEFRIVLPATEGPEDIAASAQRVPTDERRFHRILLVEDDEIVASGLSILLELEGLDVRVLNRGLPIVEVVEDFHPDAVILDLTLPDIDGAEVFRMLRKRWPQLPVLFSTGHGGDAELAAELQRGHVELLQKPYGVVELLAALQRITT